ncbi:NAD(P)-dependent oxidoreductase [Patescibacteria group bacterium]|nr:NAD(P)-dependent oxidoreductase [Patescibacteria group bacterium]
MIIVTGATGFIGKRLVSLLVEKHKPSSILCLVWNKNNEMEIKGRQTLSKLGVRMKKIDLVTKSGLGTIYKAPKIVIHLAGATDTSSSSYDCNDKGTKNLLRYLKTLGPRTHFIHISTTAIMSGRRDCRRPFDEKLTPNPTNGYSKTKLIAEEFVKKACKEKNFRLTVLRYPTVYGKNFRKNSFFDFIGKLIQKNSFVVRFNWPGLSSFVHVEDAARAIILASERPPKAGECEVYNVSTESLTLQKIAQMMYKRMGYRYHQIKLPLLFWKFAALFRPIIYKTEDYLPPSLYNLFWRASLLVDSVIYCDAFKMEKRFSKWKPNFLSDRLDDVLL